MIRNGCWLPWPLTALARWKQRRLAEKAAAERAAAEQRERELREGQEWLARVSRQYDAWMDRGGPLQPTRDRQG